MNVLIQEMTIDDYDEIYALWQESEGIELNNVDTKTILIAFLNGIRGSALWPMMMSSSWAPSSALMMAGVVILTI